MFVLWDISTVFFTHVPRSGLRRELRAQALETEEQGKTSWPACNRDLSKCQQPHLHHGDANTQLGTERNECSVLPGTSEGQKTEGKACFHACKLSARFSPLEMTLGLPMLFPNNTDALSANLDESSLRRHYLSFDAGRAQFKPLCWARVGCIYAFGSRH